MSFEHVKNKTNDAINNTLNKTERCSTLRDLITKLLDPDENSRINIDAIRKHLFFKNMGKLKRISRLQESFEYDGCKMISELQKSDYYIIEKRKKIINENEKIHFKGGGFQKKKIIPITTEYIKNIYEKINFGIRLS